MFARKVAIVGCGSIGSILAHFIDRGEAGDIELEALFDLDESLAEELADDLSISPDIETEIEEIIDDDSLDLVVEAASQEAVAEYAHDVLRSGKDLVVLSVGAFSDEELLEDVREVVREAKTRVYLPSGAILGLDGVQAAEIAEIDESVLTTRKPPETLSKTKYVKENDIDLSGLEEEELVFEGFASEAVKAFPESVNVAASLSLAGVGFDTTKVRIIADPSLDQNVHQIEIRGEAGEFRTEAKNYPSPLNPKTSYLAALSAVRTLRNLTDPVAIGV